jgi:hypothetical protein
MVSGMRHAGEVGVVCNLIEIFCSVAESGSRGTSRVVCWLRVEGATGVEGVWYSTEKVVGDVSLQWNRTISGSSPTNIFLYAPSGRILRIYRRS